MFPYTDGHVCAGRDARKLWTLVCVVAGAVVGGPIGHWYGTVLIGQVCDRPDATNLCGLTSVAVIPVFIAIGAIAGASIAALIVTVVLRRRRG
jgi:hypothetical protein